MNWVLTSLQLDWQWWLLPNFSLGQKWELWWKKYVSLVVNLLFFKPGKTKWKIWEQDFYLGHKFSLVSLQRIFIDHDQWRSRLPAGLTVLDVGAHIGEFNWFAKFGLKAKQIISIEPFAPSFQVLKKNCPDSVCIQAAISTKQKVRLYVSNLSTQLNSVHGSKTQTSVEVKGAKLDQIWQKQLKSKKINLLKIDVEGAELEALKTGTKLLKQVDYLLVELQLNGEQHYRWAAFFELISKSNPRLRIVGMSRPAAGEQSVDALLTTRL